MSQEDLAKAVAQLELESGLPRGKFAERAGHDTATIRRIIEQTTNPEDRILVNIARSCGRPYDALIRIKYEGGTLPPPPTDDVRGELDELAGQMEDLQGQVSELRDLLQELMPRRDDPAPQGDPV